MKSAILTISRQGHDVEVEVQADKPGLAYVIEDIPEYDEVGLRRLGVLYLADETIPLTRLEEAEAREQLEENNSPAEDDDVIEDNDEILTNRQQDAAADACFAHRWASLQSRSAELSRGGFSGS